ncbi:AbiJ-NTD4 domain-containing protein [Olleya marilimosa]|uniref:AbiJ-NTD4 domain-containing protein n=1 Tax=Olleya marilimosa TaxID=272164 RepID=UPI0030EE8058|tara:strand:- start:136662 stop:137519 length:858 start_codon:yes stop_codon:yes gene_type:complete
MRFSERIGKKKVKVDIQLDYIDDALMNTLWSLVSMYFIEPMKESISLSSSEYDTFIKSLWFNHFKEPIDDIPSSTIDIKYKLRKRYFSWNYLEIYDFIDFLGSTSQQNLPFDKELFIKDCNGVLKRELSGYRFVHDKLAPITSELEINSIESALGNSLENGFKGVHIHLAEALNKLSDKTNPDYRNSIKESISAVESVCQQITGDKSSELGKALKKLKEILPIHGALEQGFIKLYGYTSDGDGIRHAMMEEDNLDQEDALYMLISCSSFTNYLMTKANKLGIEIK